MTEGPIDRDYNPLSTMEETRCSVLFGGKKKSSRPSQTIPKLLYFEGDEAAFEYACKFFKCEFNEKMALTGIISDPASEKDALRVILKP